MTDDRCSTRADIEIAGSWRASRALWRTLADSEPEALGDVETEELEEREGVPDPPDRGRTYRDVVRRWRFSAWLRDSRK
jgi:hypothetical protein